MKATFPAERRRQCRQSRSAYTCADGTAVACKFQREVFKDKNGPIVPRSGIMLVPGAGPVIAVSTAWLTRDAVAVTLGCKNRSFTFPRTVVVVLDNAFCNLQSLASVRLNEGLRALGNCSFQASRIRGLVLPASVVSIGQGAFSECLDLKRADLRAARGLRVLEDDTFRDCEDLRHVLLNEGLEEIGDNCF